MGDKSKRGQRFLVVLTVLILAGIIAAMLVTSTQTGALSQKVAAAKKVGFPFEGKDLVPKFNFPESQNAAPHYLDAKKIESAIAFTDKAAGRTLRDRSLKEELTKAEMAALDQYLTELKPAIDEFQRATAMPYCYFEKDWSKGADVLLPEYADMKELSRTILARAGLRANAGDVKGAIADLESVHRAATHASQQPPIIALLMSVALESTLCRSVEGLLTTALGDVELARGLRSVIEPVTDKWDLTPFIKTEAFFGWWTAEHLGEFSDMIGVDTQESIQVKLTKNSQTTVRALKWSILGVFTPALRDYEPYSDERAVYDGIAARAAAEFNSSVLAKPYLEMILPIFTGIPDSLDRLRARKRLLLASLDVIEYRASHGAWPKSHAEVGAYTDPFDKQPLRYRIDGTGFRVWSVGMNGVDDGGKTRDETKTPDHDEVIVFTPK